MTDLLHCRNSVSGAHCLLDTGRRTAQSTPLHIKLCALRLRHNTFAPDILLAQSSAQRNVRKRFRVTAQSKEPGRKPKLSFGDQLLDYIEGGPKLRKWYGQEEAAPRDGGIEEGKDPLPKQTYSGPKDAILVTDADSPTGQLVVLSLILARKRVRALVRDAKEAKASFGPYVEPIVGEVKDRESVEKAMGEGVRAVIIPTRVGSVVDMARRAGVEHIVLLSQVGTSQQKDGGGLWGFKSLRGYLDDEASVAGGGVPYTIVRAGKLTDQPGGQTGISFGQGDTLRGTISREDAASICVQALESVPTSALVFEAVSDKQTAPVEIGEAIKGLVGAEAVS